VYEYLNITAMKGNTKHYWVQVTDLTSKKALAYRAYGKNPGQSSFKKTEFARSNHCASYRAKWLSDKNIESQSLLEEVSLDVITQQLIDNGFNIYGFPADMDYLQDESGHQQNHNGSMTLWDNIPTHYGAW